MRAVVQRVTRAQVKVEGEVVGAIEHGLLALVAAGQNGADPDGEADVLWLADKLLGLRIFPDEAGRMNRDVREAGGGLLVVSQFTLFGDCRKGRRPSFVEALAPEPAEQLYQRLLTVLRESGLPVAAGRFRADMQVELVNDGPVTLLLDSRRLF